MGATDNGRAAIQDSFYAATAELKAPGKTVTADEKAGIEFAVSSLHSSHGTAIKSVNRGFDEYLTHAANNFNKVQGNFTATGVTNGSAPHVVANAYDGSKITSYYATDLPKLDEGTLDRMKYAAQNGQITARDISAFDATSADALNNDNISVQPKIRDKINGVREAMGLPVT